MVLLIFKLTKTRPALAFDLAGVILGTEQQAAVRAITFESITEVPLSFPFSLRMTM